MDLAERLFVGLAVLSGADLLARYLRRGVSAPSAEHRVPTVNTRRVESYKIGFAGAGFHPEQNFTGRGSLRSGPF
jgi:hypothetical protein